MLAFGGIGIAIGYLLDITVWYISYDYVYAPEYFLRLGMHFGFIAGTIIALIGTFFDANKVVIHQWLISVLRILFSTLMGAVLLSLCLGGLVKTGLLSSQHETIVPLSRLYFCQGLWNGVILGSSIGILIHLRFLIKTHQNG